MAIIKIACTKCGQRVSGDESFYGTTVECPVCSSIIAFPEPITESPKDPRTDTMQQEAPQSEGDASSESPSPSPSDSEDLDAAVDGTNKELMQTTSIPLSAESIITQDANRIGKLNEALHQAPTEEEPPSTLQSVLSMVFGILGLVFFPFGAAVICSPAAIITGHIALAKARHSRIQPPPGRTMALVGVILGYAGLCVILALLATFPIWSKLLGFSEGN